MDGRERTSTTVARTILSGAAWTTLLMIIVGGVLSLPGLADRVTAAEPGSIAYLAGKALVALTGLAAVTLWIAAIWHAAVDQRERVVPRPLLIVVLVIGGFVAGLLYYFLYALWARRRTVEVSGSSS